MDKLTKDEIEKIIPGVVMTADLLKQRSNLIVVATYLKLKEDGLRVKTTAKVVQRELINNNVDGLSERRIQEILKKFREKLNSPEDERVVPLSKDWPTDPEDIAFLALMDRMWIKTGTSSTVLWTHRKIKISLSLKELLKPKLLCAFSVREKWSHPLEIVNQMAQRQQLMDILKVDISLGDIYRILLIDAGPKWEEEEVSNAKD